MGNYRKLWSLIRYKSIKTNDVFFIYIYFIFTSDKEKYLFVKLAFNKDFTLVSEVKVGFRLRHSTIAVLLTM